MRIQPLKIAGSARIDLAPYGDARGYFMRTYDKASFAAAGLPTDWVQANESLSVAKGTLRGLHYQRPPHTETKLVRAVSGAVIDVFVDLRAGSPTFGQWDSVELSAGAKNMVVVPRGCAHGFCSLTENSLVSYLVDNAYNGAAEGGVRWDDPDLSIAWPITGAPIISDKDAAWPLLRDVAPIELGTWR
ncbi:dTDP-4-dehydrorhamnose 3,5-epimerase [Dongia sp.]|uniref:dTDP-4-dehydrorhamnose 3,5-epimerase n=1 Tax=Dongia sp. TaxID=1977262 RepID=UPI0035AF06E7